ncbi:hypothetical protein NDK47_12455 [Brevibacillus ruminantium]|uniref:Phage phiEco32-like COOH-NH2 ligase-type 2 n=1 Tax=Brevibacillus ruminantium TaxID=2950604 RepID=A0ABY4WQ94_9BACL|nr:hypothetical protein [Brevibacillus ruminantium]USG68035.1 hypothetical protein NDK47_12455 [Brevibacillus ruminantium]
MFACSEEAKGSRSEWSECWQDLVLPQNHKKLVAFLKNPVRLKYLLRINGIPTTREEAPEPGTRTYRIQLIEKHVLTAERCQQQPQWLQHTVDHKRFERIDPSAEDYEVSAVLRLARRCLYAVGLYSGQIILEAASPYRIKVRAVSDTWELAHAEELSREAEKWWRAEQDRWGTHIQLKLGADPEFALRDADGKMVLASEYLGTTGVVGCDSTRYREELALHQHPLVELRPAPSGNPDILFLRIVKALGKAAQKITDKEIEWLAGGMPFEGYPIGGHIHFSGIRPHFRLLRQLDAYLALPLVLIEDQGCRQRRPRYGFLGDVREKEYGNSVSGFEYRTLPSWLVHPIVTRGVLHLAHLVAVSSELLSQDSIPPSLIRAYYSSDKERLIPFVEAMRKELSQLPDYERSRSILDQYFSYLLAVKVWPADQDLRREWCLYD